MTDVDICNQALSYSGERSITALDTPNHPLSELCATFYPQARQEALAAQRWSFAKKVTELTEDDTVTTVGFSYAHTLPTDLLRLMRVFPGTEQLAADGVTIEGVDYSNMAIDSFQIIGPDVWSDHKRVAAEYIRDMPLTDDPALWTPHFRTAVARLLAARIAGQITNEPSEIDKHIRIYETVDLPNAQFYDGVQDHSGENSNHNSRLARSKSLQARYSAHYGGTEPNDTF